MNNRITVTLDPATLATLDRVASELSSNRSQAIRYVVKMYQEREDTMSVSSIVTEVARGIQDNVPESVLISRIENAYFNSGVFAPENPALQYVRNLQEIKLLDRAFSGKFSDVVDQTLEIFSEFGRKNHEKIIKCQ